MENVSSSRSRSLGRQRGSSAERQRVPSAERQRTPSAERQRTPSQERHRNLENQRGSLSGGLTISPCTTKSSHPISAYLQSPCTGEQDLSFSQGQESSRRYASFLRQDGFLHSDIDNFNTTYNTDKSSSQTSMRLDSPHDEIAPERLGIQKRRPATTPAPLFHLQPSKSHPGPGIACNFDANLGTQADLSIKPSTTSIDEEVSVFQSGLNDVTLQLELIQETQGTILTELANDIEALQAENTFLRESRNRLQCANDNLLKVIQDLTNELALKKNLDPHMSTSSKNLANKTPQDILKGLETILQASNTNLNSNERKTVSKPREPDNAGYPRDSNKVKSRSHAGKKSAISKTSSIRSNPSRTNIQSSKHNLANARRPSSAHQSKTHNYSTQDDETDNDASTSRRHHSRKDRSQNDYDDDSDSDEYYSSKKGEKKKKKNGCFSFGRKRHSRDRDRHNRHRER